MSIHQQQDLSKILSNIPNPELIKSIKIDWTLFYLDEKSERVIVPTLDVKYRKNKKLETPIIKKILDKNIKKTLDKKRKKS